MTHKNKLSEDEENNFIAKATQNKSLKKIASIKSVNPYTLETLKTFDEITDSQLEKQLMHDAYLDWKKTS
jgi:uncharacterized protein involved in tolerance to divalent cations